MGEHICLFCLHSTYNMIQVVLSEIKINIKQSVNNYRNPIMEDVLRDKLLRRLPAD